MAEAFFNHLAGDGYRAMSAGTQPASAPHPEVVDAMTRRGVPLTSGEGRLLTEDMANAATKVIGMGCNIEEACPALRIPLEDWELEDPKGRAPEEVDRIRDEIERRVSALVEELDAAKS